MKKSLLVMLLAGLCLQGVAQIDARLMRYPDVSQSQIAFVYGDDIWVVDKNGGTAVKLSSPSGTEMFPRFSPDGTSIGYTANYDGNADIYVVANTGGIPTRLTYHGMSDRMLDWHPDGSKILFASGRESGRQRYNQFYTIAATGGQPVKLPVPYGEYASFSDDGQSLAYTDRTRVHRTWKRYRGGTAPDIHTFDLTSYATTNITNNDANDELPMWHGNAVYYLSDQGSEMRANIWKHDLFSGTDTQITNFTEFDVHYPAKGPSDIVFQAGDELYLLNLSNDQYQPVSVRIISDQMNLMPRQHNVASMLQSATISPDGNRVIAQARGELFSLPASEGYVSNVSQTSGTAERSPAWSPDGKHLACWSDASGEYQLMLYDMAGNNPPRSVGNFINGFRYDIYWSPDSRKIAFIDQAMQIQVMDVGSGNVTIVDQGKFMFHGGLSNFSVSWSPDSKWITYVREVSRVATAVFVHNTETSETHQLTSGYYADASPTFSADGRYLFYTTNRSIYPTYSSMDNTFIYTNGTMLAVGTLAEATPSLMSVKNDEVKITEEKEEAPAEAEEKGKKKKKDEKQESEEPAETKPATVIDVAGFEGRVELLEEPVGNLGRLSATDGKLIYVHYPNNGSAWGSTSSVKYYDIKGREHKTIIDRVGSYELSADGKKMLVMQNGSLAVIPVSEGAKVDKKVPTRELMMFIDPREEWRQIFVDAWRMERDYFYDPNMHGVDWDAMKERYGALIEQANSRSDVNFILGELIGELNASHTYRGGGDLEQTERRSVGYLGADFAIDNNRYKVEKIIQGAEWDAEVRSPLSKPGVNVKVGDYIHSINGIPVDGSKPIHAWLQGMAGKSVELAVSSTGNDADIRQVLIEPLRSETRLRHLEWIEGNRKRVDEATGGRVGYVYVRSTGFDGQNELIRQYYAQINKEAMIIDERFNSGGQIPDRFIEMLDRKPLAFWAVRDGEDWAWPPVANFGPKVMLINGFSGSGGDAFPDYFRKAGLGPLVGTRTWGGLIGISGAPALIDNGSVSVPTFRMYDPDGEWFKEGYGVDPDVEVVEDFTALANGEDAQLEAGINEVIRLMDSTSAFDKPERPTYESRNK